MSGYIYGMVAHLLAINQSTANGLHHIFTLYSSLCWGFLTVPELDCKYACDFIDET